MELISVYLDEGALDGPARAPSACAVVVGDHEHIARQIDTLIRELVLDPAFEHEPNYENFAKNGFHHCDDNTLAVTRFIELLPDLDFEWWCAVDLSQQITDPYEQLPAQFQWLATNILKKYRNFQVEFIFEQNERLNRLYPEIIRRATVDSGRPTGSETVRIASKQNRILSIADYCIAISSQALTAWRTACCNAKELTKRHQYRTFLGIEPLCSTLYSFDLKIGLSNRSSRLASRSYFQRMGTHHSSCPKAHQTP